LVPKFFPAGGFSSGPGGRREAGAGGLLSTVQRKRRSQDEISFGPKLRKRGSSVTPEGNKGNKGTRETDSKTVSHVTRDPG